MSISPDQFSKTVMKALADYGDKTLDILEAEVKESARQTVKQIKATAPRMTGDYAKGWSHKAQKGGVYKLSDTVYNRTDYQLTHLLEKPHATGGGGHYPKNVDYTGTLARIEEEQTQKFVEGVIAKL